MKQKIITGAILTAVFGPALYMGGPVFMVVVAVFVAIGSREISSIFEPKWPKWMMAVVLTIIVGFALTPTQYLFATVVATLFLIFVFTVVFDWFEIADGSLLFILLMILGLGVNGVLAVLGYGSLAILYVAVATYMTDTAAYFVGVRFGKHKLAPTVSPNKSIEGAIGGWVMSSLISLVYAALILANKFDMNILVVTSLLMPVVGQLGDLAFSSIKRHFNIKDFGTIFPEHGGVLDRIDSLLFNFMFFYVVLLVVA
jgi:phosphatidate cytidylyltransferase